MTITNYNDLRKWFNQQEFDGKPATYWTLYRAGEGVKDDVLQWNATVQEQEESFKMLADNIRMLNNPNGFTFKVAVTYKPKFNHHTGTVRVQIYENQIVPNGANYAIAGVQPYAIGDIKEAIKNEREKWEMEYRIKELEATPPPTLFDQISGLVKEVAKMPIAPVLIQAFLSRGNPEQAAAMATAITGLMQQPAPTTTVQPPAPKGEQAADNHPHLDEEEDEEFEKNLGFVTETLGTDDYTLMKKLANLVAQKPDLAKTMLNA